MEEHKNTSYYEQRLSDINFLKSNHRLVWASPAFGNINPYPHYFNRNNKINELLIYDNNISSSVGIEHREDIIISMKSGS